MNLTSNLSEKEDIIICKTKFYKDFNCLIRKLNYVDVPIFLLLYKSYCLSWFGSELWVNFKGCSSELKQFSIAYHKSIKKILGMSYREGNHYACHHANLLTFENTVNKSRIRFVYSLTKNKCPGIEWNYAFLNTSSHIINNFKDLLKKKTLYLI